MVCYVQELTDRAVLLDSTQPHSPTGLGWVLPCAWTWSLLSALLSFLITNAFICCCLPRSLKWPVNCWLCFQAGRTTVVAHGIRGAKERTLAFWRFGELFKYRECMGHSDHVTFCYTLNSGLATWCATVFYENHTSGASIALPIIWDFPLVQCMPSSSFFYCI